MKSLTIHNTNMQAHPLIVYDCPAKLRTFQSGFNKGRAYAGVYDDCDKCYAGNVRKELKNFNNEWVECGRYKCVDCYYPDLAPDKQKIN